MPLLDAIAKAGIRPPENASREAKKRYAELVSKELALAIATELRRRGLKGVTPIGSGRLKGGAEKRIAGGMGDKKVDVSFATDRAGLILAISIKTISFRDSKTKNYQKNLQNRKGDLVFEVATLHKRFPYAVIGGLFFLYQDAEKDNVGQARISTFDRAHQVLKMFNRRLGTRNEDSKFEYLAVGLYQSVPPKYTLYEAGEPGTPISFDSYINELLRLVSERNPEEFVFHNGFLSKPPVASPSGDLGTEDM